MAHTLQENKIVGQFGDQFNRACFCVSLDADALKHALAIELDSPELVALVEERCPYLFSARPVFASDSQIKRMVSVIRAIESVIALPAYRAHILTNASEIVRHDPGGAKGVFFGYDFHLSSDGLGLIEINTNAGGAMFNAVMARVHQSCCLDPKRMAVATESAAALEKTFVDMFLSEWKLSAKEKSLQTIAIVDTHPKQQYMYPEFLLFQQLFKRHGIQSVIVDPSDLEWRQGTLWFGDTLIDLVYNRLTDFMLETEECVALRAAYLANAVVLTPHPQAHALYADKYNLALLGNVEMLKEFGVSVDVQEILLSNIPRTSIVKAINAEQLWNDRRHLFFKPRAGFGSRATYRGDKLTKRVWAEILAGDYVAQAIMAPGERVSGSKENPEILKFDIRAYVYDGQLQWTAARLYQGQTTNFRTIGGGFSPVYSVPDTEASQDENELLKDAEDAMVCCRPTCVSAVSL